jgi:cytochrome c553
MRVLFLALILIALGSQPPAGPEWPGAASAGEGRSLIVAYGCLGCHTIPGFMGVAFRGPTLENAGHKFRPEWLRAWLRNPRSVDPEARMGSFGLNDAQIASLGAFLLSRRLAEPVHGTNPKPDLGEAHAGQALFETLARHS